MDFIGSDGWPAPLLKNAVIDQELANKLYLDCVNYMKILYNECKLVHAGMFLFVNLRFLFRFE